MCLAPTTEGAKVCVHREEGEELIGSFKEGAHRIYPSSISLFLF